MPIKTDGHSQSTPRTQRARVDAVASPRGFATNAIRAGQDPCPATGSTIVPVYQTATFTQTAVGQTKGFDYSRSGNPTRLALERQLAELEGGRNATAFGSGMAAVAGACAVLRHGDHVVATRDIYGGTHRFLSSVIERYGIDVTFADMTDLAAVRAAFRATTKLLWLETPTNPTLRLIDIAAVCALRGPGQIAVVDNTFATPYFQRPLELGADIVVHSTTKYVCGHSDVIGGVVITNDPALHEAVAFYQNAVGAVPGPWDAYLTLRGAKTLALRMNEHERNARAVAEWLEARDDVADVFYPGLTSHPDHALAGRQMSGFGGIVSFRPRGGTERAREFARSTHIFNLATSLGGVESLVCVPYAMTHASVPHEEKLALGISEDLLRLSVGIETLTDLIADLDQALERSSAVSTALAG